MSAIAKKDWLEFVRDRRLVLMAALVAALALTAIVTSWTRVAAYEADRNIAEQRDRTTWEGQGARNPHSVAHFATWAMRPLTPMALLDPGVTPYAGSAIWMEAHNQNPARARPVEDSAQAIDLGSFSIAWVLQLLAPLLIAIIAAGAVARERERGTLRLMLASGADVRELVRQKLGSVGRIAALLLVPLVCAAVLASLMAGPVNLLRLALWAVAYLLFFAVIVAGSVAISARAKTSGQAMLTLVSLWLFAFLLVPRTAAGLAETIAPQPSADALYTAMQADLDKEPDIWEKDAKAFEAGVMARYGVTRIEDLPASLDGIRLEESEAQGNKVFDRHFGALASSYAEQRGIVRTSATLSPLTAIQNVSMALAGTDMAHQLAFQAQAEAHRRKLITGLNTDMIERGKELGFDYKSDAGLWKQFADFRFVSPPLGSVLRSIWIDLAVLAAWLIAALLLLRRAARRLSREGV
jgi:ABC-2 type transport system permease protein